MDKHISYLHDISRNEKGGKCELEKEEKTRAIKQVNMTSSR